MEQILPEGVFEVLPLTPQHPSFSERPSMRSFVWWGGPNSTEFTVECKPGVDPGRMQCEARVFEGRNVTNLSFEVEVVGAEYEHIIVRGGGNPEQECGAPLKELTLAQSLGPGPSVYTSTIHAVELELQAGSLAEEVPLPVKVTPSLQFVECRTEESGR